jgi:putative PIN family toxin of toxin-antitoxin system
MRLLIDTNVFLSYLLLPERDSAPAAIIERLLANADEFLLPDHVRQEVIRKIRDKPYFAARVSLDRVSTFLDRLAVLAIPSPPNDYAIRTQTRDPNDDVLVAIALAAGVDYLISGDKDLLELGDTLAPLKIRSPQAFLDEVEGESRPGVD